MEFARHGIAIHTVPGLLLIAILALFGCGKSGPDRVEVMPAEKTMEVGETFQFKAIAWSKDKQLPDQSFEWQVEGEAGTIDSQGRFTAGKPGEAVILAGDGDMVGKSKVTVKEKPAPEPAPEPASEQEQKVTTAGPGTSGLPDVIVLSGQDFENPKKGPVTFHHLKHVNDYGVACIDCHHVYENGKNVWKPGDPVKKCSACHDPEETKGNIIKLQSAYHKNCRDCHKEMVEEGKSETAPYKKCSDCHES